MENLEPDTRPIRPPDLPDPLNPHKVWAPVVKGLYRLKESRWYLPMMAAIALLVGYLSFDSIWRLELKVRELTPFQGFTYWDFFQQGFVEQVFLGVLALILFALTRRYYLSILLYLGFLIKWGFFIYERDASYPEFSLWYSFTPVFIYILLTLLIALGLIFGKKAGLIAIVVLNSFLLANYNSDIYTAAPYETPQSVLKESEEQSALTKEKAGEPRENIAEPTIQWRSLDTGLPPIRVLRNSDLKSNFCFFTIGDITSGQYTGKKATLVTVQVDTPCNIVRPLKSYGYVVADAAGNILAWKDDYLYLQYEEECEDPFDYGGACNPANYRRYLGLLDSSIDSLPFPPELTKLTQGYIFTKESPNRALFRVADTDFYTLFPLDMSDTADAEFQLIDSTEGGAQIVRKTKTISASVGVFQNSYYLLLPFGRALKLEQVP